MDVVGKIIAEKYSVIRLLGEGGMGSVYEAQNTWTERRVALKLLHGAFAKDEAVGARFLREARASTRIDHPNIVQVLDMGRDPESGSLYIIQELLSGTDLRHALNERKRFAPREAFEVLVPTMAALAAAHRQGVVHRDLKPDNIFLARDAAGNVVPKVIDFGIAKMHEEGRMESALTRTGATMGTALYMSPEQAAGEKSIDAQTDVWALGAVLFETLSGTTPFEGDNYNQIVLRIATQPAKSLQACAPELPAELCALVHRALERDRLQRFFEMDEFLRDMLACRAFGDVDWLVALRNAYLPRERTEAAPRPAQAMATALFGASGAPAVAPSASQHPMPMPHASGFGPVPSIPRNASQGPMVMPHASGFGPVPSIPQNASQVPMAMPMPHASGFGPVPSQYASHVPTGAPYATGYGVPTNYAPAPSRAAPVIWLAVGALLAICGGVGWKLARRHHGPRAAPPATALRVQPTTVLAVRQPSPEFFHVALVAEPASALIALDGVPVGAGSIARELPRDGRAHRLDLTAAGYDPLTLEFTDRAPPEHITLLPTRRAPVAATHAVVAPTARASAPAPRRTSAPAAVRAPAPTRAPEPTPAVVTATQLIVNVGRADARVTVDGRFAPIGQRINVTAGTHTVSISAPGYLTITRAVTVMAGHAILVQVPVMQPASH